MLYYPPKHFANWQTLHNYRCLGNEFAIISTVRSRTHTKNLLIISNILLTV